MTQNADVIFVGNKPPMSYVLAIITSLSSGTLKEITLKARGQAITTAVDAAEIARNRFIKDLKVSNIAIGTAEMPPREGENKTRMVSTMERTLIKKYNWNRANISKKPLQNFLLFFDTNCFFTLAFQI